MKPSNHRSSIYPSIHPRICGFFPCFHSWPRSRSSLRPSSSPGPRRLHRNATESLIAQSRLLATRSPSPFPGTPNRPRCPSLFRAKPDLFHHHRVATCLSYLTPTASLFRLHPKDHPNRQISGLEDHIARGSTSPSTALPHPPHYHRLSNPFLISRHHLSVSPDPRHLPHPPPPAILFSSSLPHPFSPVPPTPAPSTSPSDLRLPHPRRLSVDCQAPALHQPFLYLAPLPAACCHRWSGPRIPRRRATTPPSIASKLSIFLMVVMPSVFPTANHQGCHDPPVLLPYRGHEIRTA